MGRAGLEQPERGSQGKEEEKYEPRSGGRSFFTAHQHQRGGTCGQQEKAPGEVRYECELATRRNPIGRLKMGFFAVEGLGRHSSDAQQKFRRAKRSRSGADWQQEL